MYSGKYSKAPGTRTPRAANWLAGLVLNVFLLTALQAQTPQNKDISEIARFDAVLDETSGMAIHDGSIWTHNDSGDEARIFELDMDGKIQRQVLISNADHVDWEAMAADANYLYIADTGNNANTRSTLIIYRINWSALSAKQAEAELIRIDYGDYRPGNPLTHNFDAEGLAVRGDELWLFSKNRGDGNTRLYRFPKQPGHYRPQPSQTLAVDSLVTGADIHPRSGDLILLSSRRQRENFIWWAPTSEQGVQWQALKLIRISPADQWEAIHWDPDNHCRIVLSHEDNERGFAGLAAIELHQDC